MKRALLVGIDAYDHNWPLSGCVNDVRALHPLLARNEDDSPNFQCQAHTSDQGRIDRRVLLTWIDALFSPGADTALFYFAGHGASVQNDVALVAQDSDQRDRGVSLSEILAKVQVSVTVREVIIILDCCFSGAAGGVPQVGGEAATLRPGVSILTASRGDQPAAETEDGRGQFSTFLQGALEGGAADVLGVVTVAGLYAYLSESFGAWTQRPTFKANIDRLHELRRCSPAVPLPELRCLSDTFSAPNDLFHLDPSFEPTNELNNQENERVFAMLQRWRAAKLLEPVGAEHLYFAAMESLACRLTPLGRHYWRLAKEERI